jgi:hypothetical protein
MKTTLAAALSMLMLCACATAPQMHGSFQSSFNGNHFVSGPTSIDDPRLQSPQFYMNDDASPMDRSVTPATASPFGPNYGVCAANCQAHHLSAGYCAQACGI